MQSRAPRGRDDVWVSIWELHESLNHLMVTLATCKHQRCPLPAKQYNVYIAFTKMTKTTYNLSVYLHSTTPIHVTISDDVHIDFWFLQHHFHNFLPSVPCSCSQSRPPAIRGDGVDVNPETEGQLRLDDIVEGTRRNEDLQVLLS